MIAFNISKMVYFSLDITDLCTKLYISLLIGRCMEITIPLKK
jgi:hypothetical protein